jgi:hypothetical protein
MLYLGTIVLQIFDNINRKGKELFDETNSDFNVYDSFGYSVRPGGMQ